MRFGWLFFGYLLMFQLAFGEITLLPAAGYALMLFAMLRLEKFEGAFKNAKRVLFAALPIGVALLGLQIYKTFAGDSVFGGYTVVYYIVRYASELAEMLTMVFVYIGVKSIGVNAEIRSLEKHASRNMAVMGIYLLVQVIMTVLSFTLSSEIKSGEIFKISMLYPFVIGLIWRILNLWMIFTCFTGVEMDDGKEKEHSLPETKQNIQHHKKKKRKK